MDQQKLQDCKEILRDVWDNHLTTTATTRSYLELAGRKLQNSEDVLRDIQTTLLTITTARSNLELAKRKLQDCEGKLQDIQAEKKK